MSTRLHSLFVACFVFAACVAAALPVRAQDHQRVPSPIVIKRTLERGQPQFVGAGRIVVRPMAPGDLSADPLPESPRSCAELRDLQRRIAELYADIDDISRQITDGVAAVLDGDATTDDLWDLYDRQLALTDELDLLLGIDVDALDRIVRVEWKLPLAYIWSLETLFFRVGNSHWNPWFGPDFVAVFEDTRELSAGRSLLPRAAATGNGLEPRLRYEFATSWRKFCDEGEHGGLAVLAIEGKPPRPAPFPRPIPVPVPVPVPDPIPRPVPVPGPFPGPGRAGIQQRPDAGLQDQTAASRSEFLLYVVPTTSR